MGMLLRKVRQLSKENKALTETCEKRRQMLLTMNSQAEELRQDITELAQDPNSLVGVKYRIQAEIRKNQQILYE